MPDTALIIMARYPEVGKTKTRLAASIGVEATAELYQTFLRDLARRFVDRDYDLHWAYTPPEANFNAFVATLVPTATWPMYCFPQQGIDLGQRLHHAFHWTHQHGYDYTILIGSDSPHISLEAIANARAALATADIVLGPADDGGYYLIAMRKPYDVFSGIPMSTSVVTHMTIAMAQSQGLTVQLGEPLFDIDELPDLLRLAQLLEADPSLAPATAAHLVTLRSFDDHYVPNHHSHVAALNIHRADESL